MKNERIPAPKTTLLCGQHVKSTWGVGTWIIRMLLPRNFLVWSPLSGVMLSVNELEVLHQPRVEPTGGRWQRVSEWVYKRYPRGVCLVRLLCTPFGPCRWNEYDSLVGYSATLGTQLADLHLHNQQLGEKLKKEESTVGKGQGQMEVQFVEQFGFHTVTCCGYLPQVNDWQKDWVTFFAKQRIQPQMDLIEKNSGDREARELWAQLQLKIPSLFCDVEIVPALLHGDLWGGNVAEDDSGPVIFDPASFYGHSEYELAIAGMFGGFSSSFYSAYHSKIPKAAGFEKRLKLYQLFHYMNHWNHFGTGYRGSSLNIMRNLIK
ncbi:ketosamine-3-kinase isoform X1 [Cuculus canorus]|uniref:ketosamine-3-kinase isoform X1 n=1 Tax=Cuculus canorus TaxID=55661 RepID=UPI0023AA8BD6|nr:ketosamine-3-kinase isoform X1 [Cuculus canorus]